MSHSTSDLIDSLIDSELVLEERHHALLVFWPATLLNAKVSFPSALRKSFHAAGIGTLCFNPSGHGNNEGLYKIRIEAEILARVLSSFDRSLSVYGAGHSGGASGILKAFSVAKRDAQRLYLLAPVLDGADAIRWMYQSGGIHEFLSVFKLPGSENILAELLESPKWLEEGSWKELGLDKKLDFPLYKKGAYNCSSVAVLLKDLFVGNLNAFTEYEELAQLVTAYLPEEDLWVDQEKNGQLFERSGSLVKDVPLAKDHFFSPVLHKVWEGVLSSVKDDWS